MSFGLDINKNFFNVFDFLDDKKKDLYIPIYYNE